MIQGSAVDGRNRRASMTLKEDEDEDAYVIIRYVHNSLEKLCNGPATVAHVTHVSTLVKHVPAHATGILSL